MGNEVQQKEVSVSDNLTWLRDMAGSGVSTEKSFEWLEKHVEPACQWIGSGLESQENYRRTVETVLELLARALADERLQAHFLRIASVVQTAPAMITTPFQVDFRTLIADFCANLGVLPHLKHTSARQVDALLQIYIRLIKALSFNHGISIPQDLVDQATSVSQRLDDHIENARLNQALAHYYIVNGDAFLAEQYAKMAFSDYEHVEDAGGIADAACTLAIIYRVDQRFTKVDHYVERALKMIENKPQDKRYATLFYEKGALCYCYREYHPALEFYERALAIFEQYGAVHQIAMTHQAMAQAHLFLSDFDTAETLLESARRSWEKLANQHDLVSNAFIRADLELQRGDHEAGLRRLQETLALANTVLDDTPARAHLISLIEQRIEAYSSRGAL